MPFEQARELLQKLLGIQVRKATARRATLPPLSSALAVCEAEVERLQQEMPQAPDGADQQRLSADGAEWLQGLVNYYCPDGMCILDFAHAAGAASRIGEAVRGTGGRLPASWLEGVLHRLKHQGPARVLKHPTKVVTRCPSEASQEQLSYWQKRKVHIQYPIYQAAGWPIGSGSVESGNLGVVEARLKGAGTRWQR